MGLFDFLFTSCAPGLENTKLLKEIKGIHSRVDDLESCLQKQIMDQADLFERSDNAVLIMKDLSKRIFELVESLVHENKPTSL
jgi:hypothetical protein